MRDNKIAMTQQISKSSWEVATFLIHNNMFDELWPALRKGTLQDKKWFAVAAKEVIFLQFSGPKSIWF